MTKSITVRRLLNEKPIVTNRKPGYLLFIWLLAVLCTSPQLLISSVLLVNIWKYGQLPFQNLQHWSTVYRDGDRISHSDFCQDRFIQLSYWNPIHWEVNLIDPRTRAMRQLNGEAVGNQPPQLFTCGTRAWVIGNKSARELVDGSFKPSSMTHPGWTDEQQRFLLAGEPALIRQTASGFAIATFNAGLWGVSHKLALPAGQPTMIDGIPVNFNTASRMVCINQGDRVHLFLDIDGRMLHHEGLYLQPVASTTPNAGDVEQPVSALDVENISRGTTGWTVVNSMPMKGILNGSISPTNKFVMSVKGRPVVLVVDTAKPSAVVGHFLQLENGKWVEFATQTFPFGTSGVRAVSCEDPQTAFVVATTSAGLAHVSEVNETGVHATEGAAPLQFNSFRAVRSLVEDLMLLTFALIIAGLFGTGATIAMWYCSPPDYGFGDRQVKLATIGWRALARLIDLGLIFFSTVALAWWLTLQMDWLSLAEAMSLKVAHPTVQSAIRIAWTLILWLVVCEVLIVVAQARWGVTVGKWCCGLRTMQTSLRPCGFARSLVREFVLWVDTCGFLCWTPGIASIALTDRRQRLGDIIADTIVVNASSIASNDA